MENPNKALLSEVEVFLALTSMRPTAFGLDAVNDPNFVRSLRAGREPRFETINKIRDFIRAHAQAEKVSA